MSKNGVYYPSPAYQNTKVPNANPALGVMEQGANKGNNDLFAVFQYRESLPALIWRGDLEKPPGL